jgi:CRP-like cAMP-binding protein
MSGDPFFAGLAPAAQSDLEDAIRLRRVPAGAALIEQGAAGDALYVLRHGRLRVELAETHGPSTVLAEISVGELFGEMAMLVGDRRATTVRAVRESEVIELSRAAFASPQLHIRRSPASIFDYAFDDFEVQNYQCHPAIPAPVAV